MGNFDVRDREQGETTREFLREVEFRVEDRESGMNGDLERNASLQ